MSLIWTDTEKTLLESVRSTLSTREISKLFKLVGYGRSTEAIRKMSKKLGISFKDFGLPATYDLTQLERGALQKVLSTREENISNIIPPVVESSSAKSKKTKERKELMVDLLNELRKIRSTIPRFGSVSTFKAEDKDKESLVLMLSDWHLGQIITDTEQNIEIYNTEIAIQKILDIPRKLLESLTADQIELFEEIIVVMNGDMISGEGIFPHHEMFIHEHAAEQVLRATKTIWLMIQSLENIFPLVRIVTTKGNHGRTGASPEANWDNIIYQQLELLIDIDASKNITIKNRYGDYATVNVRGWKGLVRHHAPAQADTAAGISKFASWHGMHDWDFFCFLPKTKIITYNGEQKLIEDLSPETILLGRNGTPVQIEKIHPIRNINEKVYQIEAEGLPNELIPGVTSEHPFWTIRNMYCRLPSRISRRCHPDKITTSYPCNKCNNPAQPQAEWITANSLVKGDFLAIPYPQIPEYPTLYTNGLARLLGYYLAEGHIVKEGRKSRKKALRGVGWTLHEKETEIAKDIEKLVKTHFNLELHKYPAKESKAIQYLAFGKDIANFFLENGGQYSHSKKISKWIWSLGCQDRTELLASYLKGDGCFRTRPRLEYSGSSASPNLASQLFLIGLSCKLRPTFTIQHPELSNNPNRKIKANYPKYIVSFNGPSAEILTSELNVTLKTKTNGFFYQGLYFVRILKTKTFNYKGPVFNIKTNTEEYTAGHLLTHNCYGHWHHWGVMTWNGKPIFRNGSLTGGDNYAETLSKYDSPVQLCFGVSEENPCTFVCPLKL